MFFVLLVLAIFIGSEAEAQTPPDPYAKSDHEQRIAHYYAYRDKVLANIKFVYGANACRVLTKNAADGMRNYFVRHLYEDIPLISVVPNEVSRVAPLIHQAELEGLAQSQVPNGCDWFKSNPDIVRVLRDAAQRGTYY